MSVAAPSDTPLPTRRRALAWIGGACGIAALALVSYRLSRASREPDVPMYDVELSTFVHEVSAEGNLRTKRSIAIGVPSGVPSPLKIAWTCPDGSAVKKGEVVVRFEPTDFEKRLLDGRADRASAQAKVEKEQGLAALSQRTRERSATLSALELQKAREFQARDPEIFSRNQIIESGIDEELSAARRDYADEARRIEASLSKNKIEQIAVEQRQAEMNIARANKGLANLELRAPEDGVIVFERDWLGNVTKVGDSVWEGKSIASLPVLGEMEAEVFVLEADAGGLKVGKPARVILESHTDQVYEATIASIDTLAKRPHNGVPTQYFGLRLAFEKTDALRMKPGGRVKATLVLDSQEALSVPRHAVFERDGKSVVYRWQGGQFQAVPVQLGATTPGRVVVASGLVAGDRIALADPNAGAEGEGADGQGQSGEGADDSSKAQPAGGKAGPR
ncbi:MAG TPA: HlyD family efflux transporter periplasmic adaptor subunit [Polyangiaceae bacterium]|nr:HlyD family efflux transporter periplasmic adaptor subunit [Polyangiaceae bacterium]